MCMPYAVCSVQYYYYYMRICIGTATLNGAIESGVRAAEAVLSGTGKV